MQYIDPRELNDLASFAARGGLGKGVATTDCVAEAPDQLMFIKGDELVLLRELGEVVLASCEGVVGWVRKGQVEFDNVASTSSPPPATPKSSIDVPLREGLPRTVLIAPSPPTVVSSLPDHPDLGLNAPRASRRMSGPFEFESPQQSPHSEDHEMRFFENQDPLKRTEGSQEREDGVEKDPAKRESVTSIASSALGGIGGFMMGGGDNGSEDGAALGDGIGELSDDISPATAHVETPLPTDSPPASPRIKHETSNSTDSSFSPTHSQRTSISEDSEWDIYGDYARESMYAPLKRLSLAAKRASRMPRSQNASTDSFDGLGAVNAARAALEGTKSPLGAIAAGGRRKPVALDLDKNNQEADPSTPKADARNPGITSPLKVFTGRSLATELRLRIQRERDRELVPTPSAIGSESISPGFTASDVGPSSAVETESKEIKSGAKPAFTVTTDDDDVPEPSPVAKTAQSIHSDRESGKVAEEETPVSESGHDVTKKTSDSGSAKYTSENGHASSPIGPPESDESMSTTHIETPHAPNAVTLTAPSPVEDLGELPEVEDIPALMASPMPLEDKQKLAEPLEVPSPIPDSASPKLDVASPQLVTRPPRRSSSPMSPSLAPPHPPGWASPNVAGPGKTPLSGSWSPNSPASPHSIAATRQAVEAVRSTPEGRRPRGLTLVGRMDADLSAAKGPVPISFLVGGPDVPGMPQTGPRPGIVGLGLPTSGRKSPGAQDKRRPPPLNPPMPAPDDLETIRSSPSPYPTPRRSVTSPVAARRNTEDNAAGPRPGFLAARPRRSRSFSAAVFRAVVGKRDSQALAIDTTPPMPSPATAAAAVNSKKNSIFARKSSMPLPPPPASPNLSSSPTSPVKMSRTATVPQSTTLHPNDSNLSLPPPSARSSSFSFSSKGSKTPKKSSRVLPSPVSHKDFEDTINADGLDFELVQPKKLTSSSAPQSPESITSPVMDKENEASLTAASSSNSVASRFVPDTDEWGFIKEKGVTPEVFQSRAAAGDHRTKEQKWLSIISAPMTPGGPPKKVRKLVIDSGVPASLRGRVWSWLMSASMSARIPGLYAELCKKDTSGPTDEQIDHDVANLWSDHSIFYQPNSPGRADLRAVLRAYASFVPSGYSTPLCHLVGTLLIHCVAEDAFWLLSGMMDSTLKEYYVEDEQGLAVDAGVFEGVLKGSEKELSAALKEAGVKASDFLNKWYKQMFIRCLPWPTALRVMDAVTAEGPRFLLIASLTILTLSKERLLAVPRTRSAILGYLRDLPQDSLLLPENFMKAAEKVKFRDDDWKRLRGTVEGGTGETAGGAGGAGGAGEGGKDEVMTPPTPVTAGGGDKT